VDTVREDEPDPEPDGNNGGLLDPLGLNGNGWPRWGHERPLSEKHNGETCLVRGGYVYRGSERDQMHRRVLMRGALRGRACAWS